MQKIPLAMATPGMVLAKDVTRPDNQGGPPICGKGMELSQSLIDRLMRIDIQSITVQGHPLWLEGDKTLEQLLSELEERFSRAADDPYALRLKEAYTKYLVKSMEE
jgi:hypothetical protein